MTEKVVGHNMFSALQSEGAKKKKKPRKKVVKPPPSPIVATSTNWGDMTEEDDEFFMNGNNSQSPMYQTSPPIDEEDDEEDEDETEEELSEEEASDPDDSVATITLDKIDPKPPKAKPQATQQLSKKERKRLEMEQLDALLSEVSTTAAAGSSPQTDEKPALSVETSAEVDEAAAAAAEFLGMKTIETPSSANKKKKKKKKKPSGSSPTNAQGQPLTGDSVPPTPVATTVDVKKVIAARSKGKKKASSAQKSAAAKEAEARKLKSAKKKKDKSNFNQAPR